jgi:hypothetical protein
LIRSNVSTNLQRDINKSNYTTLLQTTGVDPAVVTALSRYDTLNTVAVRKYNSIYPATNKDVAYAEYITATTAVISHIAGMILSLNTLVGLYPDLSEVYYAVIDVLTDRLEFNKNEKVKTTALKNGLDAAYQFSMNELYGLIMVYCVALHAGAPTSDIITRKANIANKTNEFITSYNTLRTNATTVALRSAYSDILEEIYYKASYYLYTNFLI